MARQKFVQMRFCPQDTDLQEVTCIQSHHWGTFPLELKCYPYSKEITAPALLKVT